MKDIKLVIFDLDGVLVDACEWHRISLNKALREICNYEISLEEHYTTFNGIPTKTKLRELNLRGIVRKTDEERIYKRKQELTVETISENANIRQEKIDLLTELRSKGYSTACYTNSIRMTAELMLEKTGIIGLFDFVLTNQDVDSPKPSPEGYNFLASHFGLNKHQVLIVEDSPKGKEAAYASGCNVLEVQDPDEVNLELFKEIL